MSSKLPDPQQALGEYLDEMLHQATVEHETRTLVDTDRRLLLSPRLLDAGADFAALLPPEEQTPASSQAPEPPPASSLPQAAEAPAPAPGDRVADASASAAITVGELDFPLQCLMFRVGGHLLSVPLIQLSSVVHRSDAPTRLPGSPDWLLGLVKHREAKLRVVDTGVLLDIDAAAHSDAQHLLVLDRGNWAITCDQLEQVVNLEFDDVQWKSRHAPGRVLGTIRDSLATLLNPPGLVAELDARASGAGEFGALADA